MLRAWPSRTLQTGERVRYTERPDSPRVARRLVRLHAHLGNTNVASGFFGRLLDRYLELI